MMLNQPGISNLIEIYSSINNLEIEETENKFNDIHMGNSRLQLQSQLFLI